MGTLIYDSTIRVDFDDRLLMHLQLVIASKFRRDESFLFSWTKPAADGGGRTAVWIDRRVPIVFDYVSSEMSSVNRQWLEELTATTFKVGGLQIIPEPGSASQSRSAVTAVLS